MSSTSLLACEPGPEPALNVRIWSAIDGTPVPGVRVKTVDGAREREIATSGPDGRASLELSATEVRLASARLAFDAHGFLRTVRDAPWMGQTEAGMDVALHPASASQSEMERYLARTADQRAQAEAESEDLEGAHREVEPEDAEASSPGARAEALVAPPATIRIWRRSLDESSTSCSGRVDVLDFEDYVSGVLPREWLAEWPPESLRAGAIAIRTYAWRWASAGGKYDCADLDDTARSQVYRDDRVETASAAVLATTGIALFATGSDRLASGEYSAENGDPTASGVDDPLCSGREVRGHGRGMCQWGSSRWARAGRDHVWIAEHYYPGTRLGPGGTRESSVLVAMEAPGSLHPGARGVVRVTLRNDGTTPWPTDSHLATTRPVRHASRLSDATWNAPGDIVGLPASVSSGESHTFAFTVRMPLDAPAESEVDETLSLVRDGMPIGTEIHLAIRTVPQSTPSESPSSCRLTSFGTPQHTVVAPCGAIIVLGITVVRATRRQRCARRRPHR